jgi:hypothetical protein
MVELLNGSRGAPMHGWVIARVSGANLIGIPKRGPGSRFAGLKPVFEFIVTAVRDPQGGIVGQRWDIVPPMFFHAIDDLDFTDEPAYFVQCDRFSHKTQRMLRSMLDGAEQMRQQLRRIDSEIALAGALPPQVPPPPGHGR